MRLDELTAGLAISSPGTAAGAAGARVTGLAYDSRAVEPGDLFICVAGYEHDGHEFAPQALAAGASALLVERPLGLGAPEVLVASARQAMAPLAVRFFGDPTRELRVVGVTGTNGKTTTAYLVRAMLEASGLQCGLLGTVKSVVAGRERTRARTTPEAIDLQGDFRAMLDGGDRACAMEVSSHALELGRTSGIRYAAAIFTNISRDHLDFHGTMEEYFLAKRSLFCPQQPPQDPAAGAGAPAPSIAAEPPEHSVINVGDPYGARLAAEIDGALTFALDRPADYSASEIRCDLGGVSFSLHTPAGARELTMPMPGRFNVANALGALAAAHALGGDLDVLCQALQRGVRVPGRFEPISEGQEFAVLVDYAHTPDSLQNVLLAARELLRARERAADGAPGRVVCVFGAGGDRDRGKRPLMGEIAARLADAVIVTSDNPRSEDPEAIIAEIMRGISPQERGDGARSLEQIVDRRAAIARAIESARAGDVVVIAGKGHEQGQEFAGGRKLPFDDVTVAREALAVRHA